MARRKPTKSSTRTPARTPRTDRIAATAFNDLLTVFDLDAARFARVLNVAAKCKVKPASFDTVLKGKSVILIFEKPSLRTRVSFDVGVAKLGGNPLFYPHHDQRLGERESLKDFAKNLDRMVDMIVARVFSQRALEEMAEHSRVPVVNALSDEHHPCQAIADLLTIKERFGDLAGLRVTYVGDGNNVTHSLVQACALAGVHVTVLSPKGYEPDEDLMATAAGVADAHAGSVRITSDISSVRDQHAIYTDAWISMHQSGSDTKERALRPFQVNERLMQTIGRKDSIFMHCLPAHRGEEVSAEVIDGPQSVVYDEAENRLWAQMGVMVELVAESAK